MRRICVFDVNETLLDYARGLFQGKPVLVGPDELLARLSMGRVEAQNLTLGKQHPDMQ